MKLAVAQGLSPRLMAPRTFERNQHEESRHLPVALAGAIVLASTALLVDRKTVTVSASASAGNALRPTKGWHTASHFKAGLDTNCNDRNVCAAIHQPEIQVPSHQYLHRVLKPAPRVYERNLLRSAGILIIFIYIGAGIFLHS